MDFLNKLKQKAGQYLSDVQKRAQEFQEKQQTNVAPQPSFSYETPQFIRDLQEKIPQFTQEKPKPAAPVLTEEDQKRAQKIIELGKSVLRDVPRSIAQFELKASGVKEFTPETRAQKFLFGKEPIKIPEEAGAEMLRGFGVGEEKARQFGGVVGYPLAVLGAIPIFPGKKKLVEELAKEGTETGIKAILKRSVKGVAESGLDDLARRLAPITDTKIIQQELESFAKTWRPEFAAKGARVPIASPEAAAEQGALAVEKLTNVLTAAKPLRGTQEALYSAERAKRVARVASVGERVPGEAGYYKQLGQLKGELPKVQFESIRKALTQTEIDELFNQIEGTKTLLPLEKVNAKTGLIKLLGAEGGAMPTRNEIELLRQIFPDDFIKAVLDKRTRMQKFWQKAGEAANLPRAFMATFDLSAPLRQGVFLIGRPRRFIPAFRDMFKYAFSEKAYEGLIEGIKARPTYRLMREAGLDLTDIGGAAKLTAREERFMSTLGERIPLWGRVMRGSNRAYTGFLNKLRADVFDDLIRKGKRLGVEDFSGVARFINHATGRGDIGGLERAAVLLNATFFSPRLMMSRLNLLNPVFYIKLDPFARKEALKSLLTFGAIAGTTLGLAKLGGADIGADPRNADFGKIKVGNTRYDIFGGFQQYIKLAAQLISGEVVSSTTGRTITLGEGYKPLTQPQILARFLESKENPVLSFATSLLRGTNFIGEDFDVAAEGINRFVPMVWQDLYDLYKERGLEGIGMGLPAFFGTGTQTYGKQELVFGKNPIGQPTAQVRSVPGVGEKVREKIFGPRSLGSSKSSSVEAYYDQLMQMPERAAAIFEEIKKINPDLAKKIRDVAKEEKEGITVHDKDLKAKGVQSGDRALAIKKDFDKLKTNKEKWALWEEYVKKGVITKDVAKQLKVLFGK